MRYFVEGTVSYIEGWSKYKGRFSPSGKVTDVPAQIIEHADGSVEIYRDGGFACEFGRFKQHFSHDGMKEVTRGTFLRHLKQGAAPWVRKQLATIKRDWKSPEATEAFHSLKGEPMREARAFVMEQIARSRALTTSDVRPFLSDNTRDITAKRPSYVPVAAYEKLQPLFVEAQSKARAATIEELRSRLTMQSSGKDWGPEILATMRKNPEITREELRRKFGLPKNPHGGFPAFYIDASRLVELERGSA